MKHNYIQIQSFGGFDSRDSHSENHQMLINGRPEIEDIKTCIIDDVCKRFPLADRTKVEYAFDHPFSGGYYAPVSVKVTELTGKTYEELLETPAFIGYNEGCFCTKIEHQYSEDVYYEVSCMEEQDALFIPLHMYVYGIKYGNTIERFYQKPFSTYEEACAYRDNWERLKQQKEDYPAYQDDATEVLVFDKKDLKNPPLQNWYEYNISIVEAMEETGEKPDSESFHISPEIHLQNLKAQRPQAFSM